MYRKLVQVDTVYSNWFGLATPLGLAHVVVNPQKIGWFNAKNDQHQNDFWFESIFGDNYREATMLHW